MTHLRKLDSFDTPWVVNWRNQNRHYFGTQSVLTTQGHRHWFHETYMQDPGDHMYLVVNGAGHGVGTIGIKIPSGEIQRVLLGDREAPEPGLMSEALQELICLYGSTRCYSLRVRSDNARAIRFYEKNGFRLATEVGEWTHMYRGAS
jgi:RimJ/RimL family protein N-acetyltransferase